MFSRSVVALAALATVHATWDCADNTLSQPIQYLKCGTGGSNRPLCNDPTATDGHGFFSLDLATGLYSVLFTISANDISSMNSCGINPVDDFAYCAARVDGSTHGTSKIRLIRFGSTHADPTNADFEYLAVLPVPADTNPTGGQNSEDQLQNTGTFSRTGNYYVRDCSNKTFFSKQ